MAAINHDVTEEQLHDAYKAVVAIQREKGHDDTDARETAQILSYAVFRGIITFDSLMESIIGNARKVFAH